METSITGRLELASQIVNERCKVGRVGTGRESEDAIKKGEPVEKCKKRDDVVKVMGKAKDLCSSLLNGYE